MFNRRANGIKRRNKAARPVLDVLEQRTVMASSFAFTAVGPALYLDLTGDAAANQFSIGKSPTLDILVQGATDGDVDFSGVVSLGDISLAQTLNPGTSFRGIRVFALGGADTIDASGADLGVTPLQYALQASGGDGDDVIVGGNGRDTLNGNAGNDIIDGALGADVIDGGAGDDDLTGGAGADALFGGVGDDVLNADRADVFAGGNGGLGIDSLIIDDAGLPLATVMNIKNNDIEFIEGSNGAERVDDSTFNDPSSLAAFGFTQVVFEGNGGNDTLVSGPSTLAGVEFLEFFDGGAGSDTIDYSASNAGVTVDLSDISFAFTFPSGAPSILPSGGFADFDVLGAVENINGSGFADLLIGTSGVNLINGGDGADEIEALGGNDTVNGGAGDDNISGSAGIDILNGDAGDDFLDGGAGNDTLNGGDGVDQVYGGIGNDILLIPYAQAIAPLGTVLDGYFGGAGMDTFRFTLVPVAVSAEVFQNSTSDFLAYQGVVLGLTDFAIPDVVTRVASAT